MIFDPMERMVLFDSSFLSLGDVRLQEEAPPDDSDEQIEQDDLDASDDQFQVPMGLVMDQMPERSRCSGSNRHPPPQRNQ
jgi:hypothetical protein